MSTNKFLMFENSDVKVYLKHDWFDYLNNATLTGNMRIDKIANTLEVEIEETIIKPKKAPSLFHLILWSFLKEGPTETIIRKDWYHEKSFHFYDKPKYTYINCERL